MFSINKSNRSFVSYAPNQGDQKVEKNRPNYAYRSQNNCAKPKKVKLYSLKLKKSTSNPF